jgi:hypothetical protein
LRGFRCIDAQFETESNKGCLKKSAIDECYGQICVVAQFETVLRVAGALFSINLQFFLIFLAEIEAVSRTIAPHLRKIQGPCSWKSGSERISFKHIVVFFASPDGPERLSKTGPFRGTSGRGGGCYVVRC